MSKLLCTRTLSPVLKEPKEEIPSVQEASSNGNQVQLSAPVLRRQSSVGQDEAPAWTGRRLAMAACVTLAGGSIAGLLGIGGGMVMGEHLGVPLLVHGHPS